MTVNRNTSAFSVFRIGLKETALSRHLVGVRKRIRFEWSHCENQIYCKPNGTPHYTAQNNFPFENFDEVGNSVLYNATPENQVTYSSRNYVNIFYKSASAQTIASVQIFCIFLNQTFLF